MMAEFQAAVASLKAATDIAKAAKAVSDFNNVATALAEVNFKLMDAIVAANASVEKQGQQLARIKDLEEELARVKAWEVQKQRYKLTSPQGLSGVVVYSLRQSASDGEPPHWICTSCYESGRRSIMNPQTDTGNWTSYICPQCKANFPTGSRGHWPIEYPPE